LRNSDNKHGFNGSEEATPQEVGAMRKWLLLAALVFALPMVMADSCSGAGGTPASGGSGTSPAAAAPKEVAVGTAMKASDGKTVTVLSFKRGFSTGNEFDTPKAGHEYVQVVYKLDNGSSSEWAEPLFGLTLIDSNGQKYNEAFVSAGEDSVDSLAAGGHAAAVHDVYEVPTGIAIDVVWQPNMFESTLFQTKLV
jgi:hypothetical protein